MLVKVVAVFLGIAVALLALLGIWLANVRRLGGDRDTGHS